MQAAELFGLVGAGFSGIICADYAIFVLKNKTKPHAFTWAIWSLVVGIVAVAQLGQGAGPGAWPALASTFYCAIIFLLSLFKGEREITRSDWAFFLAGLALIPFWHATQNALLAVVGATLIDACAYYPTVRKSWLRPHEEKISMYASDNVLWIFALLASSDYSTTTLIYPVFCLTANNALAVMIYWRRETQKHRI